MAPKKGTRWVTLLAILLLLLCAGTVLVAYWALSFQAPNGALTPTLVLSLTPSSEPTVSATAAIEPLLVVHVIDVGQGDALLFQGPDFTLLIDAGRHDREDVLPYLQRVGVERLDLLVGTHPHADHIGQFPQILGALPVGEVWLSGTEATSAIYERTLDAILASDAMYHEPRAGEAFTFGSARVEVLNPETLVNDAHEDAIVLRIVFEEMAFMLTSDAEESVEKNILGHGYPVKAQVLKLGHHGSSTSSSESFLEAVSPEIAVYSAGIGNAYGHPHRETLERLATMGIPVYGTDRYGTIRIITDGQRYTLAFERSP